MSASLFDALMEHTGTLTRNAEVRNKQLDAEGLVVPVLCLDMELEGAIHAPLHVEQFFGQDAHSQCEAAARRLKKGMRVTVQAPLLSHRLAATASHIHVITPKEQTDGEVSA
jgi:hypothetical protein